MKWAFDVQVQLDGQSEYLTVARCILVRDLEAVVGILSNHTTGKQLCIVPIPLPPEPGEEMGTQVKPLPF